MSLPGDWTVLLLLDAAALVAATGAVIFYFLRDLARKQK